MFKICQIVASISMTSQFHKFLYVIFGGFLLVETCVCCSRSCLQHYTRVISDDGDGDGGGMVVQACSDGRESLTNRYRTTNKVRMTFMFL